MSKTPEQILSSLTDEQREIMLEGSRRISHNRYAEPRTQWTHLARRKLLKSTRETYNGDMYTIYDATPKGQEVRALIVAEEAAQLGALKESLGTVTIPVWLLMLVAECGQCDEIVGLIQRSGQHEQHKELSDLAMRIARGEK